MTDIQHELRYTSREDLIAEIALLRERQEMLVEACKVIHDVAQENLRLGWAGDWFAVEAESNAAIAACKK